MQTELKDTAEEVVAMWNSRAAASNQPIGEDAANGATGKPAGQSRGYTAQLERRVKELGALFARL
jgi:hypothetical protein